MPCVGVGEWGCHVIISLLTQIEFSARSCGKFIYEYLSTRQVFGKGGGWRGVTSVVLTL